MKIFSESRKVTCSAPERKRDRAIHAAAVALLASLLSAATSQAVAAEAPLRLDTSISIPGVPIWPYVDHMAIDPVHDRLFATPQRAKSVAVIDLRTARVLRMLPGLGNPHDPFYSETLNRLFVSDGTPGDVKVFDGATYALLGTIPLAPGADGLVYDPHDHLIYVANGMGNVNGKGTHTGRASIAVIDPVRIKKIIDIPITTGGIEGMTVDPKNQLLYVSLPDAPGIGVVDLVKRRLATTWSIPHGYEPFSLALNRNRLYAACRDSLDSTDVQGTLFVLDTSNGHSIAKLPIGGWVDGISVDGKRHRVYLSSGMGYIDTYAIGPHDTYRREPRVDTALLGKTSLYSNQLDRLYVAVPQVGDGPARVMVFSPSP
jgi:Methylamine dehydrogenase heavy chain (MADH)